MCKVSGGWWNTNRACKILLNNSVMARSYVAASATVNAVRRLPDVPMATPDGFDVAPHWRRHSKPYCSSAAAGAPILYVYNHTGSLPGVTNLLVLTGSEIFNFLQKMPLAKNHIKVGSQKSNWQIKAYCFYFVLALRKYWDHSNFIENKDCFKIRYISFSTGYFFLFKNVRDCYFSVQLYIFLFKRTFKEIKISIKVNRGI